MIRDSHVVNGIAQEECLVQTNKLIIVAVRKSAAGTSVAVYEAT
jgi:hypothetical protein